MNNLIDFTNCEENLKTYNGANGSKLGIIFNGEDYLLKFPPKPTKKTDLSYSNSCFSECISCQILKTLGFKVQFTSQMSVDERLKILEQNQAMLEKTKPSRKILQ